MEERQVGHELSDSLASLIAVVAQQVSEGRICEFVKSLGSMLHKGINFDPYVSTIWRISSFDWGR